MNEPHAEWPMLPLPDRRFNEGLSDRTAYLESAKVQLAWLDDAGCLVRKRLRYRIILSNTCGRASEPDNARQSGAP